MSLQFRRHRRHGFDPWVRKVPWSRKWQPWEIPWTEEPCELQSMKLQRVWHEYIYHRLPWCLSSKESTCNAEDLWVGMILWRRKCQPTPVFLPGKSHGQWRLVGYGPWGCKTSDMTEWPNNNKYIPRLLYPFVCWWHLGGFHILVSVYSVALKTGVPVSFFFFNALLFLAVLGLRRFLQAFSHCRERGPPSSWGAQTSHCGGFSSCRAQTPECWLSNCGAPT